MTDERFKDYLKGQSAAMDSWSRPYGSQPRPRYRIKAMVSGLLKQFDFFTFAGALAYQEGELRGQGRLVELR
jgi:hypothetical protein